MATTRAQAVTRVRRVLRDWWRETDSLAASATSTATSLSVQAGSRWARGDLFQIDDEVGEVASVSANQVTVRRGRLGSSGATHADNSTVYIHSPGSFTDSDIQNAMADTERYMFPYLTEEYSATVGGTALRYLDEVDATTGWSALGEMGAVTLNTGSKQEGSGCLDLVFNYSSTGTGSVRKTITALNGRHYSYLNLFVYVANFEDGSGDNKLRKDWAFDVRIGSSASVYKSRVISPKELTTGWNLLSLSIDEMADTSTPVEMSALTRIELKAYSDKSYATGDLKMDAWWLTSYPIVKSGFQRYRNPHNVINVREIIVGGRPVTQFVADQNSFLLDTNYEQAEDFSNTGTSQPYNTSFTVGEPIIVRGQKMPEPMTSTKPLNIRNEVMELFDLYTAQKLIETKLAPRTNFESFSGRRNIADITSAEIITTQNQLFRRIKDLESKLNMPGRGMSY